MNGLYTVKVSSLVTLPFVNIVGVPNYGSWLLLGSPSINKLSLSPSSFSSSWRVGLSDQIRHLMWMLR